MTSQACKCGHAPHEAHKCQGMKFGPGGVELRCNCVAPMTSQARKPGEILDGYDVKGISYLYNAESILRPQMLSDWVCPKCEWPLSLEQWANPLLHGWNCALTRPAHGVLQRVAQGIVDTALDELWMREYTKEGNQ